MVVLVVDDDAAALEIRKRVLEGHGHTVVAATDASEARAAFAENRPDVVILDLRLPDLDDGLELIREFRDARVIVLCGNRGDLDGREEAGMVRAILQKPVRSRELLRCIEGAESRNDLG